MHAGLKQHRSSHWDGKSVSDIVSDIAGRHGLTAAIDRAVGVHVYPWFGQQDESDLHVLERPQPVRLRAGHCLARDRLLQIYARDLGTDTLINVARDGFKGLTKPQPPVQQDAK